MVKYKFKGITYTCSYDNGPTQDAQWYIDQLEHANSTGDYQTVENRITAGLIAGVLTKINQ